MPNNLGNALFAWASVILSEDLTVGGEFQFYPIAAQESKVPPVAYYEEDIDGSEQMQDRYPSVQNSTVRFACVGAFSIGGRFGGCYTRLDGPITSAEK